MENKFVKKEIVKVTLTKELDEWFKFCKSNEYSLKEAFTRTWYPTILRNEDAQETFAQAWLTGDYDVEEQLYYVKFIELNDCSYLNEFNYNNGYEGLKFDDMEETEYFKTKFTESEIKAIDERYWAFAVKVEGVG